LLFDTTIQAFDIQMISVPDEEGPHIVLQFITGLVVPGPPGKQGILPAGAIKVPIGREMAINKAKELLAAAEALPKPKPESDLIIAGNMDQAKRVADMDNAVRSGTIPE
jgi:hypothetical protein